MCHRALEGQSYCNLGSVYETLGKFQEAIDCYSKFLTIAKEVGDRALEAEAYHKLGIAYRSVGMSKEAIEYFNKQLSISKEVGDRAGQKTPMTILASL